MPTHRTAVRRLLVPALLAPLVIALTGPIGADAVPRSPGSSAKAASTAAEDLTGDIVFSVPSGTFQGSRTVGLSTAIAGAQIRYTTDGTLPTAASTLYQQPLQLTATTQLRAQAFVDGVASGEPGTSIHLARSFDATHDLPVLVIDDHGRGAPAREYVPTSVLEFSPGAGGTTSLSAAPNIATRGGFHLHGNSSALFFSKVPYRLELWDNADDDADYPLMGMPSDSDWVLRGPFTDKALIRDAFTFDVARELGLKAPRTRLAEVYVNTDGGALTAADYQGVYVVTESIKNSKDRLGLAKIKPEDDAPPAIEGGYAWKFEWQAAEEPILPCTGAAATCWRDLELVHPDPITDAQRTWLTQHIQAFHDTLHGPSAYDPVNGYAKYIDVRSFIDHIIINELGREMDGYIRSQYFYKDRGGKITAGPVWDRDLSFGVGGYFNNDQAAGWQYEQTRTPIANDWFTILLRDPAFVSQLKVRWKTLRQGVLSDASLTARIAATTAPLAGAAQRNFTKWPNLTTRNIGPFVTPTAATWQGQVDQLRTWLLARTAWLDSSAGWDVNGTTIPTPVPTTPVPTTPAPTTPAATTAAPLASCTATYSLTRQRNGRFTGTVRVRAGATAIRSWSVGLSIPSGTRVTSAWNGTLSGSTVTSTTWNGALGAGATTDFGIQGTGSGASVTVARCTTT